MGTADADKSPAYKVLGQSYAVVLHISGAGLIQQLPQLQEPSDYLWYAALLIAAALLVRFWNHVVEGYRIAKRLERIGKKNLGSRRGNRLGAGIGTDTQRRPAVKTTGRLCAVGGGVLLLLCFPMFGCQHGYRDIAV